MLSALLLWALRVEVVYRQETLRALRSGPVLLACNHVSMLDGLLVALASPLPLAVTSETLYSRDTWWSRSLFKVLERLGYGSIIPLDATFPQGMRRAARELAAGGRVVIFPEGRISRTGEPGDELPGLGWLAARTGARIVRLHIAGAENSRLFAKRGSLWWPRVTLLF